MCVNDDIDHSKKNPQLFGSTIQHKANFIDKE